MNATARSAWAALIVALTLALAAASALAVARKAACPVCAVTEGVSSAEPVKATRSHAGREYGFCSEKCAKAFSADPAAYLPPVFPRPAPELALTDLDGRAITSPSLEGRVVLLDFWATWCVPCRKSMPELQAVHDRFAARGFTVIGISIDEGGPDRVRRFLRSKRITYPVAIDSAREPAWAAYRVKAVPAAFLIDRRGRVAAQWTGAAVDPRQLEAKVDSLLGRVD